jgi:hypothetical protein
LHEFFNGGKGLAERVDHCLARNLRIAGLNRFIDAPMPLQGSRDVVGKRSPILRTSASGSINAFNNLIKFTS